jgi:hypothetical protein
MIALCGITIDPCVVQPKIRRRRRRGNKSIAGKLVRALRNVESVQSNTKTQDKKKTAVKLRPMQKLII